MTLEQARAKFARMLVNNPQIGAFLGDHVAAGTVVPSDGVLSPASNSGHYDLLEFNSCDFTGRFAIVGRAA